MSELLRMEHYTFRYPQQRRAALDDVSLRVEQGAFMVLCGPSGCGKSTLLRQLKTVLAPHGAREGAIFFDGRPLADVSEREQASGRLSSPKASSTPSRRRIFWPFWDASTASWARRSS